MAAINLAPFTQYLSPNWIDFRVQIGPASYPFDSTVTSTAQVIWAFYIAQAVVLPFIFLLGFYLIYVKVVKTKLFPWSITNGNDVDSFPFDLKDIGRIDIDIWLETRPSFSWMNVGAIVPRGPELWLIFSSLFNFIQWVYALMMLRGALQSNLAKEFMFEVKWPIAFFAATSYLFSLIHATPKSTSKGSTQAESILPPTSVLNFGYIGLSALGLFPLAFGIVTGVYADLGDDAKAAWYVSAHYLSWALTVVIYTLVLAFFGYQLVSLLNLNMRQLSSNSHSVGGSSSNVASGTNGPSSGKNVAAERMKKAIITMLITMGAISCITSVFAVLLGIYTFKREAMHFSTGINIFIAILWLFNSPFLMFLTYLGIFWITFYQKKAAEPTGETSSQLKSGKKSPSQLELGEKDDDDDKK
ncbi:hypothetical protein HDV05_006407 [Chytridiales sp. JEL 0842]|nr:hypothetical protein HDV05_006407 [Chytridiales sp. JEL 0842]